MKKISSLGLSIILATNLADTPIFEDLLSKVRTKNDDDGNILDYQVDNIKTSIKVALRLSIKQDSVISGKLKRALASLQDYGTEDGVNNIKRFLNSPESQSPLILEKLPDGNSDLIIGNTILPFIEGKGISGNQKLEDFNLFLSQTKQIFT